MWTTGVSTVAEKSQKKGVGEGAFGKCPPAFI